jgi:hypothetical protein
MAPTPKRRLLLASESRQGARPRLRFWLASRGAVAIWFMYYNFYRVHQTLRLTPAMEAGISDHLRTYKRPNCLTAFFVG